MSCRCAASHVRAVALALAAYALTAPPARAQNEDHVYAWETPARAWTELSVLNTLVVESQAPYEQFSGAATRSGLQQHFVELGYGMTDAWEVGAYGDFERSPGGPFRYSGVRLETSYRLFDRYQRLVDSALHLELRLPRGSSGHDEELEALVVLQRDWGDFRGVLNPAVELPLSGEHFAEGVSFRVAAGLYWRRFWRLQPSLEYFGEIGPVADPKPPDEERHVIYPGVRVRIVPGMSWLLSAGFGLNRASDGWLLRGVFSYEFSTLRPSEQAF